jgi:acyl-CoA synthetase (AMP-forming)/AMP-acid ligase II
LTAVADPPWRSVPELVRAQADLYGGNEAVVDGDVRLSFAELATQVGRAARAFMASGVAHGDRVAIWAPNIHEWIVAALGLQSAGAVLVPLNTRFKGVEAGDLLSRSEARMLLVVGDFLGTDYVTMLREACGGRGRSRPVEGIPSLDEIVVLRGRRVEATISWEALLGRGSGVSTVQLQKRVDSVGADDLSDIMFTSGTTGRAKGVLLTHGQMLRTYASACEVAGLRSDDRYLIVPPFFHSFGYKFGFVAALIAGATALPLAVLDVPVLLSLIEKEGVTFLPGPPTLHHSILDHPDRHRFDLSSLRATLLGGAVVPEQLVRRLRDELTFETVLTAYGLTESSAVGTICGRDDSDETVAQTSGRAFPGTEVIVGDDAGAEVSRGERGEVLIRGANVMRGYLDDPDQTAATISADGWLRTGDIGVMDDLGYLRIVDRKKDMFIVGGFNAYPAEIESMMLENDKIAQVAVVGAPDDRLGEVGVAFVQLHRGREATADEITGWCRSHMANYKVPRRIEFTDALPLTASGKVIKSVLRQRARTPAEPS